jgi:predicted  nucleic acid-binding Zn-ribbon protein
MKGKEISEELLLVDNGNNSFRIRDPNVKHVHFLPKGDQWQIVGGGNMFIISNDKPELRASSIGIDKREAIANAERDVDHLTEELKRLKAEDSKLENEHTQLQRQWNRANRAMQQNDDRINELSTNIENMSAEIQASVSVTFDPSEYEEDVTQAEAQVEQVKEKIDRLTKELKNREPEIEDLKSRIAEVDARNKKVASDIDAVQARILTWATSCMNCRSLAHTYHFFARPHCRKSPSDCSRRKLKPKPRWRSERQSSTRCARKCNR